MVIVLLHLKLSLILNYVYHILFLWIIEISEEKYSHSDTEEEEEYKEDQYSDTEEQPTAVFLRNPFNNRPITFKRILQHFAVYTKQKKSSMTYLLNLLIRHQPDPMHDTLPHTGKQLLHIDV